EIADGVEVLVEGAFSVFLHRPHGHIVGWVEAREAVVAPSLPSVDDEVECLFTAVVQSGLVGRARWVRSPPARVIGTDITVRTRTRESHPHVALAGNSQRWIIIKYGSAGVVEDKSALGERRGRAGERQTKPFGPVAVGTRGGAR